MKKYLIPLLIAAAVLAAGCGGSTEEPEMTQTPEPQAGQVQAGDTIRVDYTGTLDDGTEFDSSFGREPLQFTVGDGMMIAGFDQAVRGMEVGESKSVVIPAEEAYGPYRDDLVFEESRDNLPPDIDPQVGEQLQTRTQEGQVVIVTVIAVSETTITLDANHSLAGKDLTFDIQIVEIL